MSRFLVLSALGLVLAGTTVRQVEAAQAAGVNTMVTVKKGGCGFIDAIQYKDRQVVKATPAFVGGSVRLALTGNGSAESLFANQATVVLTSVLSNVTAGKDGITVVGRYTKDKLAVPFTRQIQVDASRDVIAITEDSDFGSLDPKYVIAEHSWDLPLSVNDDPHLRMFAFGGEHRVEMFRMDMNDVSRRSVQNISSARGFWPYWDIGGVLQLHNSYRVWKANHADTMAYPIEEGNGTPGWADYSELNWGVTATVGDAKNSAPWAIMIDARKAVLRVSPHPSSQLPVSGADYGKRRFALSLALHETSWPTAHPCELDLGLYESLLENLKERGYTSVIANSLGTSNAQAIIHCERAQPSVVLRALYRGDAWRMQALMKSIGKDVPRNQPMKNWEQDAKEFLEYVTSKGLPKAQAKP